jgi:hypothetical protein
MIVKPPYARLSVSFFNSCEKEGLRICGRFKIRRSRTRSITRLGVLEVGSVRSVEQLVMQGGGVTLESGGGIFCGGMTRHLGLGVIARTP